MTGPECRCGHVLAVHIPIGGCRSGEHDGPECNCSAFAPRENGPPLRGARLDVDPGRVVDRLVVDAAAIVLGFRCTSCGTADGWSGIAVNARREVCCYHCSAVRP